MQPSADDQAYAGGGADPGDGAVEAVAAPVQWEPPEPRLTS